VAEAGFAELEQPAAASAQALIIPVIRRIRWRRVVRFMSGRLPQQVVSAMSEKWLAGEALATSRL